MLQKDGMDIAIQQTSDPLDQAQLTGDRELVVDDLTRGFRLSRHLHAPRCGESDATT